MPLGRDSILMPTRNPILCASESFQTRRAGAQGPWVGEYCSDHDKQPCVTYATLLLNDSFESRERAGSRDRWRATDGLRTGDGFFSSKRFPCGVSIFVNPTLFVSTKKVATHSKFDMASVISADAPLGRLPRNNTQDPKRVPPLLIPEARKDQAHHSTLSAEVSDLSSARCVYGFHIALLHGTCC